MGFPAAGLTPASDGMEGQVVVMDDRHLLAPEWPVDIPLMMRFVRRCPENARCHAVPWRAFDVMRDAALRAPIGSISRSFFYEMLTGLMAANGAVAHENIGFATRDPDRTKLVSLSVPRERPKHGKTDTCRNFQRMGHGGRPGK